MSNTLLGRMAVEQMPDGAQAAWKQLNTLTGEASFVEVFAAAPELLDFVMKDFYTDIFFGGRVGQKYKQLMRLKLSMIHGCRTCNLQNAPAALEAGVSQQQVAALGEFAGGPFSEAEQAVLEYTELLAMPNQTRRMDADLYGRLSRHFSDAEICELGTVGAVITGMAKLSFVLDLVEQEEYCSFR